MSTTPVTGPTSSPFTNAATGTGALGQNAFLQLLTTELQYQDPLNPMDNTQFVSQLAQFSQLEQLTNLNQTMTGMGTNLTTLNNNQVTNLIGRTVTAQGGTLALNGGLLPAMAYTLGGNASRVTITITDGAGNLVRSIQTGPQAAGPQSITWDGMNNLGSGVSQGIYNYNVAAVDPAGNPVSATSYATGLVSGVAYNNGTPYLLVNGSMVPASGVLQVNQ